MIVEFARTENVTIEGRIAEVGTAWGWRVLLKVDGDTQADAMGRHGDPGKAMNDMLLKVQEFKRKDGVQ